MLQLSHHYMPATGRENFRQGSVGQQGLLQGPTLAQENGSDVAAVTWPRRACLGQELPDKGR